MEEIRRAHKAEVEEIRRAHEEEAEEIRRAYKAEVEEIRRDYKAEAEENRRKGMEEAMERADAVETKATALQESTLTIMSQMLTLQAESADQYERTEAKEESIQ